MKGIHRSVAQARRDLGLTQGELSGLARVSLATLQNVEAGRANPSVKTLQRILRVIGLEVEVRSAAPDWDMLADLGIPVLKTAGPSVRPTPELLLYHLRRVLARLGSETPAETDGRKREAVQSTLLALKRHFPAFYARHLARSSLVKSQMPEVPSGRLIRLGRLAARRLAEYL